MKKVVTSMLILVLLGMVAASGCLGGGGESSKTSPTSSTTAPASSLPTTSKPSSSPSTSSPSETATTQPSTTSSTSPSETTTTSQTPSPTTTTPSEEASWEHPWEYAPVNIGGESYWITYYKYDYKIQPNQSAPVYEYIIEKSVGRTKVHVYGQDLSGNRVDLGEKEVYEYVTVVTPVKGKVLDDRLTLKVWFVSNKSEAFLYPWDVLWMTYLSPYSRDKEFVGMELEYKGDTLLFTNPAPFGGNLFPYFDGNQDELSNITEDLSYLYMWWAAVLHLGFWYDWSDVNVLVPQSGTWSDMEGHSWAWSTEPDGTAEYSGFTFRLVDFQWSYEGTFEGVKLQGKGKFSPNLPIVVESEGYSSYKDPETGKTTVIYGYLKLEDLKLEKVGS